jgi:hypothetical protein
MAFNCIYRNLQRVSWDFILLLTHHVKPFPSGFAPTQNFHVNIVKCVEVCMEGRRYFSGHSMVGIEGGARSPSNDFFIFFPFLGNLSPYYNTFSISTHMSVE